MENLGIDLKLLVAQAINFALFFLVFKRFLAKPFGEFIQNEKKLEIEREKLAQEMTKKEEDFKNKQSTLDKDIQNKAERAIADAKKASEEVRQSILEQANQEAQQVKEKAKKQADEMEANLLKKAEQRAVELGFFLSEQALKDTLTPELKKKLTQAILRNSKQKTG